MSLLSSDCGWYGPSWKSRSSCCDRCAARYSRTYRRLFCPPKDDCGWHGPSWRKIGCCKVCHGFYKTRRYRILNPIVKHDRRISEETRKARHRAAKYNISAEQYEAILNAANGQCNVCDETAPLEIDHCHKTGRIRGALCRKCNMAIGMVNDDVGILLGLISYLKRDSFLEGMTEQGYVILPGGGKSHRIKPLGTVETGFVRTG